MHSQCFTLPDFCLVCTGTKQAVSQLIEQLNKGSIDKSIEVVVAPTYIHLHHVLDSIDSKYEVGAQNCWASGTGAYTGEVRLDYGLPDNTVHALCCPQCLTTQCSLCSLLDDVMWAMRCGQEQCNRFDQDWSMSIVAMQSATPAHVHCAIVHSVLQISAEQLVDLGVQWVILGHSERRSLLQESNELVGEKVAYALSHGLRVIACVGETLDQRKSGQVHPPLARCLHRGALQICCNPVGP